MDEVTLLRDTLRPHLGWHGARLSFVSMFLIALLRTRTVNLSELATAFCGKVQIDSCYKRLQRFFREYEVDEITIAQTVVALRKIPQPWVLSVDRTEWQLGKRVFNLLVLAVVHQGVAIPLVWTRLNKRGNSHTVEGMQLFSRFLEHFAHVQVSYPPQIGSLSGRTGLAISMPPQTHRFVFGFERITNFLMASTH